MKLLYVYFLGVGFGFFQSKAFLEEITFLAIRPPVVLQVGSQNFIDIVNVIMTHY